MDVGFTGTQRGMTVEQWNTLCRMLNVRAPGTLHQGDCLGSDHHAVGAACLLRHQHGVVFRIICHPPDNSSKRAFAFADEVRPALPYLTRNKNIVHACQELIATPYEADEQLRSGTWSTVRYARRLGKPVHVILPDGSVL